MARGRAFDETAAVRAAREIFWEQGYEHTSLLDLQRATGLSRSSMYATFGSKRGLYERASLNYLTEIIDPMLTPMEQPDAAPATIAGFFTLMTTVLRSPDMRFARRGCFVLNTILELDQLDAPANDMVVDYRARVFRALANALASVEAEEHRQRRAEVLTSAHIGIMITARVDTAAAAVASEAIAAEYL